MRFLLLLSLLSSDLARMYAFRMAKSKSTKIERIDVSYSSYRSYAMLKSNLEHLVNWLFSIEHGMAIWTMMAFTGLLFFLSISYFC
jgi:hypothetical protein